MAGWLVNDKYYELGWLVNDECDELEWRDGW